MEHHLDVSELEPPEPLEQILDALADLPAGDWLRVHHRREPHPLYGMLRRMNYRWTTICYGSNDFEIVIWPADIEPPTEVAKGPQRQC